MERGATPPSFEKQKFVSLQNIPLVVVGTIKGRRSKPHSITIHNS